MKKTLIALMLVVILALTSCAATAEVYSRQGVIVEMNCLDWTMLILDDIGMVWECEIDDDWNIGDVVNIVFDDCETLILFDDVVLALDYIDSIGIEGIAQMLGNE